MPFIVYTAEISTVFARRGLKFHQYADDCQIYTSVSASYAHQLSTRTSSRVVYKTWRNGWVRAGCVWMPARHRCCDWIVNRFSPWCTGSCHVSNDPHRQLCTRPRPCHWQSWSTMSRQSVALHVINCDRFDLYNTKITDWCHTDASARIYR